MEKTNVKKRKNCRWIIWSSTRTKINDRVRWRDSVNDHDPSGRRVLKWKRCGTNGEFDFISVRTRATDILTRRPQSWRARRRNFRTCTNAIGRSAVPAGRSFETPAAVRGTKANRSRRTTRTRNGQTGRGGFKAKPPWASRGDRSGGARTRPSAGWSHWRRSASASVSAILCSRGFRVLPCSSAVTVPVTRAKTRPRQFSPSANNSPTQQRRPSPSESQPDRRHQQQSSVELCTVWVLL